MKFAFQRFASAILPTAFAVLTAGISSTALFVRPSIAAAPRELEIGIPGLDFQTVFEKQLQKKSPPIDLVAFYTKNRRMLIAAVWERQTSADFQVQAGLSREAMRKAITDFGGKGYRLAHMTGSGSGGPELYTGIWNKAPGQKLVVRYGFPQKELLALHAKQAANKYLIHRIMAVEVNNTIRFSAVWEADVTALRELRIGLSETAFRRETLTRPKKGFRLRQAFVYVEKRRVKYACIWEKSDGPQQLIRYRMTAVALKKMRAKMTKRGYRPAQIHGYAVNGRALYVAVWEETAKKSR